MRRFLRCRSLFCFSAHNSGGPSAWTEEATVSLPVRDHVFALRFALTKDGLTSIAKLGLSLRRTPGWNVRFCLALRASQKMGSHGSVFGQPAASESGVRVSLVLVKSHLGIEQSRVGPVCQRGSRTLPYICARIVGPCYASLLGLHGIKLLACCS